MASKTTGGYRLVEFKDLYIPKNELAYALGREIWSSYPRWIDLTFPSPRTDDRWVLRSNGFVGYLPTSEGTVITIEPRTPVKAIFKMWEIAYGASPKWVTGGVKIESLEDLYSWIASELAAGVLGRVNRGLYRRYVQIEESLLTIRGRIDLRRALERPWNVAIPCAYGDLTADIDDNRLLAWALRVAARSVIAGSVRQKVREAYWKLAQRCITLQDFPPIACLGRNYSRLNQDYERLHWFCHFLLAGTGPTHLSGDVPLQPFVIDMPDLFERFVAGWLAQKIGARVRRQEHLRLHQALEFIPDITLRDQVGRVTVVLDTKYKIAPTLDPHDVAQVVAYAKAVDCHEAVLVYPQALAEAFEAYVGDVRVRALTFPLDDLQTGGESFLGQLMVERLPMTEMETRLSA